MDVNQEEEEEVPLEGVGLLVEAVSCEVEEACQVEGAY